MKKTLQLDLSQSKKKDKSIQVQSWVNSALNTTNHTESKSSGKKLELNMTFSKSILNRR